MCDYQPNSRTNIPQDTLPYAVEPVSTVRQLDLRNGIVERYHLLSSGGMADVENERG